MQQPCRSDRSEQGFRGRDSPLRSAPAQSKESPDGTRLDACGTAAGHARARRFRDRRPRRGRRWPTGEVRVANRWLSVDPYMRGRMNDVKSYVPPFQIGAPMEGGAVGEVVESRADGLARRRHGPAHARLARRGGRRRPTQFSKLPRARRAGRRRSSGQLGMPGMTAYFGLLEVAEAKAGRHGVRLRRGGRGRIDRGAGRQGQGHDGDRIGRRRGQVRLGASRSAPTR